MVSGENKTPADDLIDLTHQSVSLAVTEMCCRVGIDSGSFKRAAQTLKRVGQLVLSDEALRQIVESQGKAVLQWQDQGQLELDFDAGACLTHATADGQAVSRLYVGIDGFMIPMVSDQEVQKRHEKARLRRKKLKKRKGLRRPRLVRRCGADQRYKEFKLVMFYDQEQTRKLLRVTKGSPEHAGRMLGLMAEEVRLSRAGEVVAITDGAEWISGLVQGLPPEKTTAILDYYHAAVHVHEARRIVYGEASEEGNKWAQEILGRMLEGTIESWREPLAESQRRARSPAKRKALEGLLQYLLKRKENVLYARFRAKGLKIGSGPTESACKSEARRLKGIGMRWTSEHAQTLLALEGLHQSTLWQHYWNSRLKSAA